MTRAEEKAAEAYPNGVCFSFTPLDLNAYRREAFIQGYSQAEKDILSKITKEHLDGLKWIEHADITTQPIPYHKYCKELRKILEELLNHE